MRQPRADIGAALQREELGLVLQAPHRRTHHQPPIVVLEGVAPARVEDGAYVAVPPLRQQQFPFFSVVVHLSQCPFKKNLGAQVVDTHILYVN